MVSDVPSATGFAVVYRGRIAVMTVSPSPRGAKLNGLDALFAEIVLDTDTDTEIDVAWEVARLRHPDAEIVVVEIVAR